MGRKKLSESEINEIISYYKSGASQTEVASKFNIGVDYVRSIMKKNGILRSKEENKKFKGARKIQFSEEEIKCILEFYSKNSLEKTAKNFNVSIDTIARVLKENNYARTKEAKIELVAESRKKSTREKYPLDEQDIVYMYLNGESVNNIISKYHLQNSDLNHILEKNGVDKRKKEEINALRESTLLSHYGVSIPLHSLEIWKKKEETTLKRYGVTNVGFLPEVKEKREITCLERYGFYTL